MGRPSKMAIDTQSRVCEAVFRPAPRYQGASVGIPPRHGTGSQSHVRGLSGGGDEFAAFLDPLKGGVFASHAPLVKRP